MDCPRCNTKLWAGTDEHGDHFYCLCCGYYKDKTPYIGSCRTHPAVVDSGYQSWTMKQINRIYAKPSEVHNA